MIFVHGLAASGRILRHPTGSAGITELIGRRRVDLDLGKYRSLTETLVAAYALHEIESLRENTLISNLDFYPALTYSMIAALRKAALGRTQARARVTFFSTMLPRHYFMFPHARAGTVQSTASPEAKFPFTRVSYPEEFVDEYKARLQDMIGARDNAITFRRYTVVLEDESVLDTWRTSHTAKLTPNEPPPLLKDFIKDTTRVLSPKVPLSNVKDEAPILEDLFCSLGTDVPRANFERGWLEQLVPQTVPAIHLLLNPARRPELENLVAKFATDFHSPRSCHLLIIRHEDCSAPLDFSPLQALHVYPTTCPITKFNISPDCVHFSVNDGHERDAFLIANIELRNKSVVLRYLASDYRRFNETTEATDTEKLDSYRKFIAWLESDRAEVPYDQEVLTLFDAQILEFAPNRTSDAHLLLIALRLEVQEQWHHYDQAMQTSIIEVLRPTYATCRLLCDAIQKCLEL